MKKELLSIMFLLGVSFLLLNILPYFNQNESFEAQLMKEKILTKVLMR